MCCSEIYIYIEEEDRVIATRGFWLMVLGTRGIIVKDRMRKIKRESLCGTVLVFVTSQFTEKDGTSDGVVG